MGLFSFTQEIAIDLGTANTIIMCDDKIVVDEPSVVAISMADNKMVAVGRKAQQMIGKGGSMIRTVRPLRDGVIADFYACEMMSRGMIKMIPKQARLFTPSIRMVVCIPSGSTEVDNEDRESILKSGDNVVLGDIYISVEVAKDHAKEYGHSLDRELRFLFIHGLLHLLGYDHMTKEDEEIMFPLQEKILSLQTVCRA